MKLTTAHGVAFCLVIFAVYGIYRIVTSTVKGYRLIKAKLRRVSYAR